MPAIWMSITGCGICRLKWRYEGVEPKRKRAAKKRPVFLFGGGDDRIRTGGFTVLQTVPLDHSGTSPLARIITISGN